MFHIFLHTMSDNNLTRPQHITQTHNKHHHGGGGRFIKENGIYQNAPCPLPILAILGDCWMEMMQWCHVCVYRPPLIPSSNHMGHIQSILAPFNEGHKHISAPLHRNTAKAGSDFGKTGWLWFKMMPWCHSWGCRPPLSAFHIQIINK